MSFDPFPPGFLGPRRLVPFARVEARLEATAWGYPEREREAVAASWAARTAGKPALFDGRVLLQGSAVADRGTLRATFFEGSYAALMAWRDAGFPAAPGEEGVRNAFAMAALRASDGGFLLGVMGQHTANAGRVYFPAGTPDRGDLREDGTVDLAGSVLRELEEETGLLPHEVEIAPRWTAVTGRGWMALMRPVAIDLPAAEARALILSRLGRQAQPEFEDIVVARGPADLDPVRMSPFTLAYLAHALDGEPAEAEEPRDLDEVL